MENAKTQDKEKENDIVGEGNGKQVGGHTVNEILVNISKDGKPEDFKLDDSGAVIGLENFEDILDMLGPFGRWNVITMVVICLGVYILPFQSLTYEFLGNTPEYWCEVDELIQANWTQEQMYNIAIPHTSNDTNEKSCKYYTYDYKKAVELGYDAVIQNPSLILAGSNNTDYCKSRFFNVSDYSTTLVAEWDLVCERRWMYSTTQSISQLGILFGVLSCGYLMDLYGRRPVILISVFLSLLAGLGAAVSPVFPLYLFLKLLVSCFNYAYFTGSFIYLMEICSPSQRSSIGATGGIPWSLGYMTVPGIAYLIGPWRWLQAVYTIPTVFFLSYYWLLPESPRWLISAGRYDEAAKTIAKAAKMNGRVFPSHEALVASLAKMIQVKAEKPQGSRCQQIVGALKHFIILVLEKQHRKRILISYFCWFAVSMVYYGISLNSGNLSTDPYIYVFLGGLVEIPSYFITWYMIYKIGRRLSLSIYYFVCVICISIVAILLVALEEVSKGLLIFLSLVGKTSIICAFHVVYIYTAELFPTRYRSLAVGESSMMARVGSVMSPYINDILGAYVTWGPSALFAVMSALATALALLQPETRDSITEDTPPESKESPSTEKENPGDIKLKTKYANVNEAFEQN